MTKVQSTSKITTSSIPASFRGPRRPLVTTVISVSSCGISVILCRKSFSKDSAIRTISSPGCRSENRRDEKTPTYLLSLSAPCWTAASDVADLVVDVAVSEHGVEVMDALLGVPIVVVLQALLYCPHVHRRLDDFVVVLDEEQTRESLIRNSTVKEPKNKKEQKVWFTICNKAKGTKHSKI